MRVKLVFLTLIWIGFTIRLCVGTELHHHVYYYPLQPYIYEDTTSGQTTGMIVEILQNAMIYCIERQTGIKMRFHYYKIFEGHKDYTAFIQSNFQQGTGRVAEAKPPSYLWMGPFLSLDVPNPHHTWVNGAFQMALSPGAYVVADRDLVSWKWKMVEGIRNCRNYFVLAVLISICMGTIVYLIVSDTTLFSTTI